MDTVDILFEMRGAVLFVEPLTEFGHVWIGEYAHELGPYRFGNKIVTTVEKFEHIKELMKEDGAEWGIKR